jgi:hypothetical protein
MNKFDEILRRDDVWFQTAVGVAFLVFFTVIIGTLIAFFAGDGDAVHLGARIDIVYKLGLIGAGLITFCTVAWRGLLATQQVDAQRKQIEKLSEQISATAENNLASLLQKGAELVSNEKPGYISAGIATLQAVATDKNPKFAKEALDVLADYLQAEYPANNGPLVSAVFSALLAGETLSRRSDRNLSFAQENVTWEPVFGVQRVRYEGGEILGFKLAKMTSKGIGVNFKRSKIRGGKVTVTSFGFQDCVFKNSKILKLDDQYFGSVAFEKCNFSDAVVVDPNDITFEADAGNWFAPDHPPTTSSNDPLNLERFASPPEDAEEQI